MKFRGTSTVLACLVLGVGLSACSSDDDKSEDGAIETVEDYFESVNDGNYSDACDELSDDYIDQMLEEWNAEWDDGEESFGDATSCSGVLEQSATMMRAFSDLDEGEILIEIDEMVAEVDGDTAVVDVSFKGEDPSTMELIYDDGEWLIDKDSDDEQGSDEGSDDAASEETEEPPPAPSSIGEPVEFGDWTLTVTKIEKNADATIAKIEYNDKPKHRFTLVTYEAVYNGSQRTASAQSDMSWTFTTSDAQVLEPTSVITPGEMQDWPSEVRSGGTVKGQVVFDVDPSVYDGGTLGVEGYDDEFDEIFVDFTIE